MSLPILCTPGHTELTVVNEVCSIAAGGVLALSSFSFCCVAGISGFQPLLGKPLLGVGCATSGLHGGQLLTPQVEKLHINILSGGCLLTQQMLIVSCRREVWVHCLAGTVFMRIS